MGFGNAAPERPYSRTINWKSSLCEFQEYDKDTSSNKKVDIDRFVVLEEMTSVSGYSQKANKGIWSNEVLDLKHEKLQVRIGNEIEYEGYWSEIKDAVNGAGGKFTNVVIALLPSNEIVRFLFSGAACSGWIGKRFNPMARQCGVKFAGTTEEQTGSIKYNVPTFEPIELTEDQKKVAIKKWEELDAWLGQRNEHNQETSHDEHAQAAPEPEAKAPYSDEVPF